VSDSGISIENAKLAAQKIDHSANTIDGLRRHAQRLHDDLRVGWDSDAADAFTTMFHNFDNDFGKVIAALQDMHLKLGQGALKFEGAVQEQTDAVNRVNMVDAAINS
jgi:WXG100 family type VII secretion target